MEDKELEITNKAMDLIIDILGKAGDLRFVFVKKVNDFYEKLNEIATDFDITDKQFEILNDLLDMFEKTLDNSLKKED